MAGDRGDERGFDLDLGEPRDGGVAQVAEHEGAELGGELGLAFLVGAAG